MGRGYPKDGQLRPGGRCPPIDHTERNLPIHPPGALQEGRTNPDQTRLLNSETFSPVPVAPNRQPPGYQ